MLVGEVGSSGEPLGWGGAALAPPPAEEDPSPWYRKVLDFLILDDVNTLGDPNASPGAKILAVASSVPAGKAVKLLKVGKLFKATRIDKAVGKFERVLANGRVRTYDKLRLPNKPGRVAGSRKVREVDPSTGQSRVWIENYDDQGRVIIVHPKKPSGPHYMMDAETGKHTGETFP